MPLGAYAVGARRVVVVLLGCTPCRFRQVESATDSEISVHIPPSPKRRPEDIAKSFFRARRNGRRWLQTFFKKVGGNVGPGVR